MVKSGVMVMEMVMETAGTGMGMGMGMGMGWLFVGGGWWALLEWWGEERSVG